METIRFETKSSAVSADGIIDFVGSTATPDRIGDIVDTKGWDLAAFKQNPVVLYAHRHDDLPIAKAIAVGVEGNALKFRAQFVPAEIYPFAGVVKSLYEHGFLRAFSVGFRTTEPTTSSGVGFGERIGKAELLEVSAVPVPMNAEALIASKSTGAKVAPLFAKADAEKLSARMVEGRDDVRVKAWLAESDAPAPLAESELDAVKAELADLRGIVEAHIARAKQAMEPTVAATQTPAPALVASKADAETEQETAEESAAFDAAKATLDAAIAAGRASLGAEQ